MQLPPGYTLIGPVYPGRGGVLARARRHEDDRVVVLCGTDPSAPLEAMLEHFDAELEHATARGGRQAALHRLDGAQRSWLVYEDVQGAPLDASFPWPLEAFWAVARRLAAALAEHHRHGQVHGRLEGNCVWWDPDGPGTVAILGCVGPAQSALVFEFPATTDTAPELLGRRASLIEPTADVYSLGSIFYRLLSGRPPIETTGGIAFDLAANAPAPLDTSRVPRGLAKLVLQMLSKSPVARPSDGDEVLKLLAAVEAGTELPRLSLRLPAAALVSRGAELDVLLGAAHRLGDGKSQLLGVVGEPGVGKSCLLGAFMDRLSSASYLVARGKFEQTSQGQPYSALLAACRNALGRALSGDERVFRNTSTRLLEANATLLGVLRPYLQELKHLCPVLPEPPEVGPLENRQRFTRACLELLGALASPELPFVVVLDDVHWADHATAALLTELVTSGLPERLLLVLSYRPEDAEQNLDIAPFLRSLPEASRIRVTPFEAAQTEELCRKLIPNCNDLPSLAAVVQQQSGGNALYCIELIRSLAATGELAQSGERWSYAAGTGRFVPVSDTVIGLIRARLMSEDEVTRHLLGAAAHIGSTFSLELLADATGLGLEALSAPLTAAARHGLVDVWQHSGGTYAFSHDRIQETALSLLGESETVAIRLRLGRHYRKLAATEHSALFQGLDHLNAVRHTLEPDELSTLRQLNWQGAKLARRAIAYGRGISSVQIYLEEGGLTRRERFEATLLLAECHLLSDEVAKDTGVEAGPAAESALRACAALAETNEEQLAILRMRLSIGVAKQSYAAVVELGLEALKLLDYRVPPRPTLARVLASVLSLKARLRGNDIARLADRGDTAPATIHDTTDVLMRLGAAAHWTRPLLGALVLARLVDLTLRYGNGPQSSMAYASYGFICHMQGDHEAAIRYGHLADTLAQGHSVYTRAMVRFQTTTFFGPFEHEPRALLVRYRETLNECVSHGELIGSHLIDGAVTMLPHFGPRLPRVLDELESYAREARKAGAKTSLEMIGLVRHWCDLLQADSPAAAPDSSSDASTSAGTPSLYGPVTNESFAGGRDLLRMQVEYLSGNDDAVLELARSVRKDPLLKGNPLHRASYAVFVILAATRSEKAFTRVANEALRFLQHLNRVKGTGSGGPRNFSAAVLLAEGLRAHLQRRSDAIDLLERAAAEAAAAGQELLRALCLERLALAHAADGRYPEFVERMRASAQAFQHFGATAKARALVAAYSGIDWTHLVGGQPKQLGVQVEGVLRAASAIAEVTSTGELGPTLLRVIATTAGALRAFLFVPKDGTFVMVAGCERDQVETTLEPTALHELAPSYLATRVVRYVERSQEGVELPRDAQRFTGDPYLERVQGLRGLLCVPLLYRAEMVAILYLEGSCNAESFSQEDANLVTLLGRHAAIALSNADTHRLEIEALQSKVNPHFLYNALSVIAELIGRAPAAAEDAVFKLTKLYRYMLSTPAAQRVSLDKELTLVRDYLELEKARFGDRLSVAWDVQTDVSRFQVPALLIQPLAENAVNHGVRRNVNGGTVSIAVRESGDHLVLTVRDDGPGWYEGNGGTGFGLRSVRRRLELVYGGRAQLNITKRNGVAVELTLPW